MLLLIVNLKFIIAKCGNKVINTKHNTPFHISICQMPVRLVDSYLLYKYVHI